MLPSSINLVGADVELVNKPNREYILRGIVAEIKNDYDFVFIDCLPSLGLITVNALVAADTVLIPVQCEMFSFEGLSKLKNTINIVKQGYNSNLQVEGLLISISSSTATFTVSAFPSRTGSPQPIIPSSVSILRKSHLGGTLNSS